MTSRSTCPARPSAPMPTSPLPPYGHWNGIPSCPSNKSTSPSPRAGSSSRVRSSGNQRLDAERVVRRLSGVIGVTNLILVKTAGALQAQAKDSAGIVAVPSSTASAFQVKAERSKVVQGDGALMGGETRSGADGVVRAGRPRPTTASQSRLSLYRDRPRESCALFCSVSLFWHIEG